MAASATLLELAPAFSVRITGIMPMCGSGHYSQEMTDSAPTPPDDPDGLDAEVVLDTGI